MVYPMYYIYLRLLTVDEVFTFKKHSIYFAMPILCFLFYVVGIIITDSSDYHVWLYNKQTHLTTNSLTYLNVVSQLIRFVFIVQVIFIMLASSKLLKRYSDIAEQYYSDVDDGKNRNVKFINTSMIVAGLSSIVLAALSRYYFLNETVLIGIASFIFSSLLFMIGYMGFKQKSADTQLSLVGANISDTSFNTSVLKEFTNEMANNVLISKIVELFENQKLYLNDDLTIVDLANIMGTNRTYISQVINQKYNQNFCSFVNNFRIEEVKRVILSDPTSSNQDLAEKCGFTSPDTLKRVVKNITGMSVTELKNHLLKK